MSAYAASPAHTRWNPRLEHELLSSVCSLPGVAGLEVPWLGALHPHDVPWFLDNVPTGAQLSLTALPWVMRRCGEDSGYGIASPDHAGRASALADLRSLAADVRRVPHDSGASVEIINLHTAPRNGGSVQALSESLSEIADWDWGDAGLVVEHCDAAIPGRQVEKGFLRLDEEFAAIERSKTSVGLWLNWGRSVIELRDFDAVTAQISSVAQSGRLVGLTFSGASAVDGPYGMAWADAHLPMLSADPTSASLLDDAHLQSALVAAGDVPWHGLKVSRRPSDLTADDVTRTISENLLRVHASMLTA
ncbi:DUF4862 family protein [Cryobacterium sp. N19]|uniref:DUF4862 family protein n=1 Tax=Cryobacterium sp. N19 TaxID=2048288 RepID=UPI001304FCDD|nr:DUF4862 family protein [Cryobacterium sp. N19]